MINNIKNMKTNNIIKVCLGLAVLACITPVFASAATVYTDATKANIFVGDTIIVEVKVDSDKAVVNSVEGDITLQSEGAVFEVKEFSLAGSIFGLWPRTPSLSNGGKVVSFVGGVPGGFNAQGARLFTLILEVKKEGTIKISPRNVVVFANDGKGTKLPVSLKDITLNVGPKAEGGVPNDEWTALLTSDITAPEAFVVVLGKDPSLFENNTFAFFSAFDSGSGVSYYEVSENGKPAVRSGSMYVLQDQNTSNVKLKVTAYDKSGNKRTVNYVKPGQAIFGFSWAFFVIVVLMLVVWYFLRRRKSRKIANTVDVL